MSSPAKLLMTWDIAPGCEEACIAFIRRELPSRMKEAGLEQTDAWFTEHGDWPQIRIGFVCSDVDVLEAYIRSDEWGKLKQRLLTYTHNYQEKVIAARGGFQI